MGQVLQLAGAFLVLLAFAALQRGRLEPFSRLYLSLNLAGATLLAIAALEGPNWGFLLLEAVWGGVSAWGLAQVLRGRLPGPAR